VTFTTIDYAVVDHVATITLNRPDRLNAWTARMGHELIDAFDRADGDDDVRAVIVTGAGRGFCAGADLAEGRETFQVGQTDLEVHRDGGGVLALRVFACRKPVIAAINGSAVGIGATMTLPMDIRIASDAARMGFVFVRRGIVPDAASSWFLPRIVGISRALEWTTSGRLFTAGEALEAGLVRSVHPAQEVLLAAQAIAREVVDHAAPVSVALTRQMLWQMLGAGHPMQAHRAESRALYARGRSADAAEGVAAFLEKRPAAFPDRVSQEALIDV
jgi:enoyl-CoA hydratase/carnithine racemase